MPVSIRIDDVLQTIWVDEKEMIFELPVDKDQKWLSSTPG